MSSELITLTYEIDLQPGEKLNLPDSILENVAAGRWIITIQQKLPESNVTRSHDAFLHGYALEDEGLYEDYPSR
ncbi:hypothetical protein A2T98_20005 [Nodularia spumigena CENA596]|uniref:Uncharacterized protein n=1 Tax=Nodularia spumigena CENA596 TaxID=1819295 RepID=A0A161VA43_NODSP|nr:hypothetical protein [Nodularia spumigena]KZL48076.1 hypothetical protein A2T98_20005 [Nodularia spumigena CENA596]